MAIANRMAAERYGLTVVAANIADHPGNQTRFVVVARDGVPAHRPRPDRDGGVPARRRPGKPGVDPPGVRGPADQPVEPDQPADQGRGLGDNCFVIYADAHIGDELLADAMRALHLKQGEVKFLGSYPIAGDPPDQGDDHHDARWDAAQDWVAGLQAMIER